MQAGVEETGVMGLKEEGMVMGLHQRHQQNWGGCDISRVNGLRWCHRIDSGWEGGVGWAGVSYIGGSWQDRYVGRRGWLVGHVESQWWLRCSGEDATATLVVLEEVRVVGLGVGGWSWHHLPWQSRGVESLTFDAIWCVGAEGWGLVSLTWQNGRARAASLMFNAIWHGRVEGWGSSTLNVALLSLGFMLALSYGHHHFASSLVFVLAVSCGGDQ